MIRRKSRELCLQILFQKEFNSKFDLADSINYFKIHHQAKAEITDYANYLAGGVLNKSDEIDALINSNSNNWKTSRMSSVDLNILRMAVFEAVLADEINAPKVVINEALEIAKKYSSSDASSFINGILDHVIKTESQSLSE